MEQVTPSQTRDSISNLLQRFFPFYCLLVAVATFGYTLYGPYNIDGDAVAYMDIGDLLRAHRWHGIVNAYWHPMYPTFLSLGHILFRSTRADELHAYYMVNFGIFLLEMLAIVLFTDSLLRLRSALEPATGPSGFLLSKYPLRYLALALLVIASQRELAIADVRPDALLQAFLLFALAALLTHLATTRLRFAALMGLALGCAYLTKSFAFLFAILCIFALFVFRQLWLRHKPSPIVASSLIALTCFAVVAGPYIAALSLQKHRFDFGDSGSLNYAWYVAGTEKMHLEPWMTSQFGSATVHLKHPERQLLESPPVYSYAALPYGTYPDWFDTTYWNDQIKPRFTFRREIPRFSRNLVLVVRYLFNHPEALILLGLLILFGARLTLPWKPAPQSASSPLSGNPFWITPLLLGAAIWGIYAIVNTEERYVTVAYLVLILTLFALLRLPASLSNPRTNSEASAVPMLRPVASALILLLALLATCESLRNIFEDRRLESGAGYPAGWYSPAMFHTAEALESLGVRPGDTVACLGESACLHDFYWARLAGVRILTEVYDPETPVPQFLDTMPNREQAIDIVRTQGAKVIVADFDHGRLTPFDPALKDWQELDGTTFYALPLNPNLNPGR